MGDDPVLSNGVPYDQEMHLIAERAVVFLTIFLLFNGLLPEDFKDRVRPAMIAFRVSQILLAIFVLLPEKEQQATAAYQRKAAYRRKVGYQREHVVQIVHRSVKAWYKYG